MRSFINGRYLKENSPAVFCESIFPHIQPLKNSINGKDGITRNGVYGKTNNNKLQGSRFPLSFFQDGYNSALLCGKRRPGHPT